MQSDSEPSIAEFRAWMTRTPLDDDRCTCGARFLAGRWHPVSVVPGHFRCYARFRDERVAEPIS
jgi:hypothetical protein